MDMLSYFLGRLAGGGAGGSGGDNGPIYTDLVYNDDGSITLTDEEGQEHIMECEYVDGRLEKIKIDGNILDAVYEEDTDKLVKLGDINIEVGDYPSEIGNIETLIDNSGVLDSTEGTATEKVEQLIDKAEELDAFMNITNGASLFNRAKSFPSKAVVNLPNATTLNNAFSNWNVEPIPIVEDLTVNAPNIVSSTTCLSQMFNNNYGVKKVVLNLPDSIQSMQSTFTETKNLEELVLNFSTKTNVVFNTTFQSSGVKKIIGVLDFSSATNTNFMFRGCTNLEDVRFAPNTLSISTSLSNSGKLTSESVQSIIDGLTTVETAQTLTLNANTKILQSQVDSANAKGWTVAGGTVVSEEEYYG